MNHPLTKKHTPKHTKDIIGQSRGVDSAKRFVIDYKKQRKKLLIIYGPPGCGKTATVYAIAAELNLEIIEVNASDIRNEDAINSIIGSASQQMSLFGTGKIILIDELDGISGNQDRGGLAALAKLLEDSSFPLIATANDPWDKKFSAIRSKSELLQFESLDTNSVYSILSNVCQKEGITFVEAALKALANRSGGDARGALNDLQLLSQNSNLEKSDVDGLSYRDREESIKKALVKIFRSTDLKIASKALENTSEDMDEAILWIEENIPLEYKRPEEIAKAFDALSKADVFRGRIRRQQHWRFLVYINDLATAGVALAKTAKQDSFVIYKPTSRILKMYIAAMKFQKRKAIAQKIASKTHSSKKEVIKSTLPYMQFIFRKNKKQAAELASQFEFDTEEVEWLRK